MTTRENQPDGLVSPTSQEVMAQDFLAELALVIDLPHCEQQFLDLLHLAQNLACLLLVCPLQEEQWPIAGDVFFPLQVSHFMSFIPLNPRL
ncbi:MAG: hypothetical protein IT342_25405 [Candidatus Melainabacteria bacterium]|nr:hypothetical protein [Candidatus Melainabacteria bacterium]